MCLSAPPTAGEESRTEGEGSAIEDSSSQRGDRKVSAPQAFQTPSINNPSPPPLSGNSPALHGNAQTTAVHPHCCHGNTHAGEVPNGGQLPSGQKTAAGAPPVEGKSLCSVWKGESPSSRGEIPFTSGESPSCNLCVC